MQLDQFIPKLIDSFVKDFDKFPSTQWAVLLIFFQFPNMVFNHIITNGKFAESIKGLIFRYDLESWGKICDAIVKIFKPYGLQENLTADTIHKEYEKISTIIKLNLLRLQFLKDLADAFKDAKPSDNKIDNLITNFITASDKISKNPQDNSKKPQYHSAFALDVQDIYLECARLAKAAGNIPFALRFYFAIFQSSSNKAIIKEASDFMFEQALSGDWKFSFHQVTQNTMIFSEIAKGVQLYPIKQEKKLSDKMAGVVACQFVIKQRKIKNKNETDSFDLLNDKFERLKEHMKGSLTNSSARSTINMPFFTSAATSVELSNINDIKSLIGHLDNEGVQAFMDYYSNEGPGSADFSLWANDENAERFAESVEPAVV